MEEWRVTGLAIKFPVACQVMDVTGNVMAGRNRDFAGFGRRLRG
jgi:hypothetical protein